MIEPDFLSQTAEAKTPEQRAEWAIARSREARAAGASWWRFTFRRAENLLLFEGWLKRPTDADGNLYEGAPRFQYAAA